MPRFGRKKPAEMDMAGVPGTEYQSPVNETYVKNLSDTLQRYAHGKKALEGRIIENERWFMSQHWDLIRQRQKNTDPEPVTAYLFSTIANKHADAMDYYPQPNFLEREESDKDEAARLSAIVPLVLEQNRFRNVYSSEWWYKLKQGCGVYGCFWDTTKGNGMGDVVIRKLDLLTLYWEPGVEDVQNSPKFYILSLQDDELLKQAYPQMADRISANKVLDVQTYFRDDTIDTTNKSVVVDCYEKQQAEDGRMVVHLTKFVDYIPLASTLDNPETAETGLYNHGMYPVVYDVLFPIEGSPVGFGYVDVVKNPQMYIDKLDQIISKNALISGKQRIMVKESGAVNEGELSDLSRDIIHTKGGCKEGEDFATIQVKPLPPFIYQHRQGKIQELKETSGANEFSRGESMGGITAASAIMALQEAGNKLSRDMIGTSYEAYQQLVYMVIELIAQFYDEGRKFRITNDSGEPEYVTYTNESLKEQAIPPEVPGMEQQEGYEPKYRKPIFDIKVKPEKASPFSQVALNELAKELFQIGAFNPEQAVPAKIMLEMMTFEGKDKIYKMVSQNGDLYQQMQQVVAQVQQQQAIIAQMNQIITATTGNDMMAGTQTPAEAVGQQGGQMNGQG